MAVVSVLTPAGRGAVATLCVDGIAVLDEPLPLFVAANGQTIQKQRLNRVCFGRWGDESPEEVVVCRVDADAVEIHCHGGDAAVSRIVADLEARGCSTGSAGASPSQQDGLIDSDIIEAACREALIRATTLRTADILWQQCQGRLAKAVADLETLPPEEAKQQATDMLRWVEFGRHLTQPWQVVLGGRPNVGKSSLINALVGYGRSIVFDQPGTTRDVVTVETAIDGWPIEFSDTAGLRDNADELERAGITRARRRLSAADLRILLLDISRPPHDDDRRLLDEWPDALIIAHKSDLPNVWRGELPEESLPVSSITGSGVTELSAKITACLIPHVPLPLTPIPICHRQSTALEEYLAMFETNG